MNPALLSMGLSLITEILKSAPSFVAEYQAAKSAGSFTADQQAQLDAQIEAMDTARKSSWAEADAALDAAIAGG